MSGRMQENSDIAARLVPEETRAGGMTTPVLWRAEASIRMERMASALVTASKEAITSFAKFLTVHIIHGRYRARRPRCGNQQLESRVRENRQHGSEGGEAKAFPTPIRGHVTRPLGCFVARAPRNDGKGVSRLPRSSAPASLQIFRASNAELFQRSVVPRAKLFQGMCWQLYT